MVKRANHLKNKNDEFNVIKRNKRGKQQNKIS